MSLDPSGGAVGGFAVGGGAVGGDDGGTVSLPSQTIQLVGIAPTLVFGTPRLRHVVRPRPIGDMLIEAGSETIEALSEVGQFVTLRRPGAPPTDVACLSFVRGFSSEEMNGGLISGDRSAIVSDKEIAAAGWPGPPRKGDQLVVRGRTATLQNVETVVLGDVIVRHNLTIRGP